MIRFVFQTDPRVFMYVGNGIGEYFIRCRWHRNQYLILFYQQNCSLTLV